MCVVWSPFLNHALATEMNTESLGDVRAAASPLGLLLPSLQHAPQLLLSLPSTHLSLEKANQSTAPPLPAPTLESRFLPKAWMARRR